mmetsp:Transcript_6310/g.23095  ORF Transcript_6310/g.23095 Transcript_6310/m.23095 type:complete len:338 (-) Transcript_6310:2978-3991(-)
MAVRRAAHGALHRALREALQRESVVRIAPPGRRQARRGHPRRGPPDRDRGGAHRRRELLGATRGRDLLALRPRAPRPLVEAALLRAALRGGDPRARRHEQHRGGERRARAIAVVRGQVRARVGRGVSPGKVRREDALQTNAVARVARRAIQTRRGNRHGVRQEPVRRVAERRQGDRGGGGERGDAVDARPGGEPDRRRKGEGGGERPRRESRRPPLKPLAESHRGRGRARDRAVASPHERPRARGPDGQQDSRGRRARRRRRVDDERELRFFFAAIESLRRRRGRRRGVPSADEEHDDAADQPRGVLAGVRVRGGARGVDRAAARDVDFDRRRRERF